MDTLEANWVILMAILIGVAILLSKASTHSERLKRIETLLMSHPDIDKTVLDLSPEVKQMIAQGHKHRAIALYREQTDSTGRNAELAIEKYIAQQT